MSVSLVRINLRRLRESLKHKIQAHFIYRLPANISAENCSFLNFKKSWNFYTVSAWIFLFCNENSLGCGNYSRVETRFLRKLGSQSFKLKSHLTLWFHDRESTASLCPILGMLRFLLFFWPNEKAGSTESIMSTSQTSMIGAILPIATKTGNMCKIFSLVF